MNLNSGLFADIEERKQPLLSIPPLNFDNLRDDEPLRETEHFTFRGEEDVPAGQEVEEGPPQASESEPMVFDSKQLDAINGLKEYHFSKDGIKWQNKIFLRKHFSALTESGAQSKDLEFETSDLQDISFGDSQLALEILQREAEEQDMRSLSEAEIRVAIGEWFRVKGAVKKQEQVKPPSDYSQSEMNNIDMWEKAVERDRDYRAQSQAMKKVVPQDSNLEEFGKLVQEEKSMTIQHANEWIAKNQGQEKVTNILQDKFIEQMQKYDKFKRQFLSRGNDMEMVSCQGQVQYLVRVDPSTNNKLQIEHYRFNQLVKALTLNEDVTYCAHSSFISFQQCGTLIYFFKVKTVDDDQIQETQPTDITNFSGPKNRTGKNVKKVVFSLCSYDMSLDSLDQEPVVMQNYEAPTKFDTQNGSQLLPISVIFVNQQTSEYSKTKQNWPKGVPGNDCQKFLESMVMAIVYQNPDNQSYKLSFRSLNSKKFTEQELFYTQKSFPLNKCLQILVAKKSLNKELPSSQVLTIFCGGKGYYAFSTETNLCMGTGGGIGTYISKFNDLEAFKPQNKTLQNLLNKITINQVKFYNSSLSILDEKQDFWNIKNSEVLQRIWKLMEKLLEQSTSQMPQINAFYDVIQDTLTVILNSFTNFPLEVIMVNRKTNRQLFAESLRDQSSLYGFVPPHLRVIQLKHYSSVETSLTNFIEDKDTFIQASYQYTNLVRDNQVVYLQYKVQGDPIVKELNDQDFLLKFLNSPVLHQDKSCKKGSRFTSNGHSTNFVAPDKTEYQIGWSEGKFSAQTDSLLCRIRMEKIIFQEDDRVERPMVAIRESQFGKIESLWFIIHNLKTKEISNQQEIIIEREDLEIINEVFISASSEIDEPTSSQNFQVCLQMITNQVKIIEFKVYWVQNTSNKTYTTRVELIGQKLITQNNQNFGEILFFGPLFKQNYEIVGTQIIQRDNNKLSYLNLENMKSHEFQFQNEFADIGYIKDRDILIVEILFSQRLQLDKDISTHDKLEIGEQMIQASLILMPFKVHEYLLTEDWSSLFFTNQELLNGYSFADFCLNDHVLIKEKVADRMSEKRDKLLSVDMQEFDPIFEKTIHLTSLLERCIQNQQFNDSKMVLMDPMLLECDKLNLNSTKYLNLLENIDLIILSNCRNFQAKLLSSESKISLSPLQLKRKLQNCSKVNSFTSYDLALNLRKQKLENTDVVKLALIDQQWTNAKVYYTMQTVTYFFGYFLMFYGALYQWASFCANLCLVTSLGLWTVTFVTLEGNYSWQKVLDLIFFLVYPLYYCLDKKRLSIEDLLESNEITDEVLSKGFFEILTVILIIHSLLKLGELTQTIDICRRTYLIIKNCMLDTLMLMIISGVIIGCFGVTNQVLSPNKIAFGESVVQVYDQMFSFEFSNIEENSNQLKNFTIIMRLFQQFIFPIIMLNIIFSTLIQSYDQALGNDFQNYHFFKASVNLEYFTLLKQLSQLPPLTHLEFQVSASLAKELSETSSSWHGFVQTLKNFIHLERQTSDSIISKINAQIQKIDSKLAQALDTNIPEMAQEARIKANAMTTDVDKVKIIVQEILDKNNQQENQKQLKVQQQASTGWLGAFGPRSSIISTSNLNTEQNEQKTPRKSERIDSHQSPVRRNAAGLTQGQVTSRYKEKETYSSPIRSVRK